MAKNIQEQINVLVRLQDIENKIATIKARMSKEDDKFRKFKSRLEISARKLRALESDIAEFKEQYRAYESDSKLYADRIDKSNSKLISVKTNREYNSVLKEIEDLKEKNFQNDENMIFCLDSIEKAEKDFAAKKDEHALTAKNIRDEKVAFEKEIAEDRKQFAMLEKEKNEVSGKIKPELLDQFLSIKKNGNGVAISRVIDAICQGCNMNIPPQTYNELQGFDSLSRCPFCHRIIYWQKP